LENQRLASSALESLGEFQPIDDNYLFGFRGSIGPFEGVSAEAIYQREIETDRSGISSERIGLEAGYRTADNRWLLEGNADYDLATGWWGRAGAKLGWWPEQKIYVEGRLFRYRPVFSLQTIWVAFTPTPYSGWGAAVAAGPFNDVSLRAEVDRRSYGDSEADVSFFETTERTWRARVQASWQPQARWDVQGSYSLLWGFGAARSAADVRFDYDLSPDLSVGVKGGAFEQIWEFRIGENLVWNWGADARWRARVGTLWGAVDGYRHNRKNDPARLDWTQWRAALGISYYLGSEPGRAP
jgi:hypothetical protein